MTAEDAEIAAALGVTGVFVSNHGARQVDTVHATVIVNCSVAVKY
jgi:isopentenyl diphosphate isomerase/L-lactate dehydrogenase-like FMN-dependent dehydrogenase